MERSDTQHDSGPGERACRDYHPSLRPWGQRMWERGYFACSTGNVSDEMIAAYIEHHSETEEQFKVVDPGDFESS